MYAALYKTCVNTNSALNLSKAENCSGKLACYLLSTFCSIITILTNKNVHYLKEILHDVDPQLCLFSREIVWLRTSQAYLNCWWYCAEQCSRSFSHLWNLTQLTICLAHLSRSILLAQASDRDQPRQNINLVTKSNNVWGNDLKIHVLISGPHSEQV